MVCRFFAGLGGSAPLSIGGGVLGDSWQAHERGRAIAVYSLMPLIGPAIGKSSLSALDQVKLLKVVQVPSREVSSQKTQHGAGHSGPHQPRAA